MSWSAPSSAWLRSWGAARRWQRRPLQLASPASPARATWHGARTIVDMSYSRHFLDFQGSSIPTCMKKLVVAKLSANFREAVTLRHSVPVPLPGDGDLLVRNRFVGINASDINYSAGRYDTTVKPPFDIGFEGIGEVVALGLSASARYTVGQAVAYVKPGAFAEYTIVPSKEAIPVPSVKPEFLTLLVSGTTAYISLKELGELCEGKTVLVTAAAGGTGQFAVQLSKKAKCHVIGTCSSDEKSGFLKSIGCDHPINYKTENVTEVLKKDYPQGVDVVYESVGGKMFDMAVNSLAIKGRLIVIGFISGYQTRTGLQPGYVEMLPAKLLKKSASIRGFFLNHYFSEYQMAMKHLLEMCENRELVCEVDLGEMAPEGKFTGLESVFRAIDYMYMGKNIGKIVVELPHSVNSKL
ncbi:PREDICTED: zinc-binding alcohol dehydrogenase domain-containing protein 2 isoform X1 [Gekko japonicus]|uniref:Zinc-binding alcohol dehydrogenase domain-containing protein 2 isoform X1 n=1 Tax=Gekko japonicus TaxID=146911 RepID=A0ABM1KET5_GEKJA|nr:PREDICTED: zinc-binding alcohol dehydrogenase domain-containing protein 2 isoform X1 [Gekko japonicus]